MCPRTPSHGNVFYICVGEKYTFRDFESELHNEVASALAFKMFVKLKRASDDGFFVIFLRIVSLKHFPPLLSLVACS